jgi:DNA-binding MarR family transcriptional regulator
MKKKESRSVEPDNEIDYGPLADLIGYRLKRAHGYSLQRWQTLWDTLPIPYGQYSVLLVISLNPGLSQLVLAESVGLDGSTLVPITNRFVRRGWIRRGRRKDDRRTYALRLTPAGQAVLDKARKILKAHEQDLASPLSIREQASLRRLLQKITDGRAFGPVASQPNADGETNEAT